MKPFLRILEDYGMVFVLLVICIGYSLATIEPQKAVGAEGAKSIVNQLVSQAGKDGFVFISAGAKPEDAAFVATLESELVDRGVRTQSASGAPSETKLALTALAEENDLPTAIACSPSTSSWKVFGPAGSVAKIFPTERKWPNFLKRDNLRNVAGQIAVIAIIAIGMTLVIITAGIDLSVGSLVALASVATAWMIVQLGAKEASVISMMVGACAGMLIAGLFGLFTGVMVTKFQLPSFIVTLGVMLMASGIAFEWSHGESIPDVPESFTWIGRDSTFGLPNCAILMVILYVIGHFVMTRTALGRYIYAVGGNPEAARLSGVPVNRVLLVVYAISGILAGLGGVIIASQLGGGSPRFGASYELKVIAAVVVGGTSIAGGSGRIFNTLIGSLTIGVIENGMNLTNVTPYRQNVVLGAVILGAVLLDQFKKRWTGKTVG